MIQSNNGMQKEKFGHKVLILGNKCYRCENEWRPHEIEVIPRTCPKCKSPYWDRPTRKSSEKNADNHKKSK